MKRVIVVGAGLAGISAARSLQAHGIEVVLLEAGRDVGGRLAARPVGADLLDAGAPYFTVRDPAFRVALQPLLDRGLVVPWAERLFRWDGQALTADSLTSTERRFASPGGMGAVATALSEGLDVRRGVKVVGLSAHRGKWTVSCEGAERPADPTADVVVLAMPAPTAGALVATAEGAIDAAVREELNRVQFDPCHVVLAGYDPALPAIPWRGVASSAEPIQWIGLESSKRPSAERTLSIHSTGEWSRSALHHLSDDDVRAELLSAAAPIVGDWVAHPSWSRVELWPHAKPVLLATGRALLSEDAGPPIAFCGDWCQAPRVEGAFQSGLSAADRLIFAGLL